MKRSTSSVARTRPWKPMAVAPMTGHRAGVVNKQTARVTALEYAYLWKMLGGKS